MTFTDLEIALGVAFGFMIWINYSLKREIEGRKTERDHFIDLLIAIAEKRKKVIRRENGVAVITTEIVNEDK